MNVYNYLFKDDDTIIVVQELLKLVNVQVTRTSLRQNLSYHPDFPSMLSISDALSLYNIDNVTVETTVAALPRLIFPSIVPVINSSGKRSFSIIKSATKENIQVFDVDTGQFRNLEMPKFDEIWEPKFITLIDSENAKSEVGFKEKRKQEFWVELLEIGIPSFLPLFVIVAAIFGGIFLSLPFGVFSTLLVLFSGLGLMACSLIILYEIDEHSPVIKDICKSNEKVNCGAVLNSKASRILGTTWGEIGVIYFCAIALFLLTSGLTNGSSWHLISYVSLLASLYTIFSIYYQWRIVRQWCILCISVQAILLIQAMIASQILIDQSLSKSIVLSDIISLSCSILFAFVSVKLIKPALIRSKENRVILADLKRFKNNPDIFKGVLDRQRRMEIDTAGLGFTFGSKEPRIKLTKVCNPYCGPCAKSHNVVEHLLNTVTGIQVQLIFAVVPDGDFRADPVRHFFGILESHGEAVLLEALHFWYNSETKDYSRLARRYPLAGDLMDHTDKLSAMHAWCRKSNILSTPTFFVNEKQLPDSYNVSDLKNFISI